MADQAGDIRQFHPGLIQSGGKGVSETMEALPLNSNPLEDPTELD